MSKLYFAKLVPVEGEIKRGDKAFDQHGILQHIDLDAQLKLLPNINKTYKLAQLSLCSRDIKVGDKVWDSKYERYDIAIESASLGIVSKTSFSEAMQPHFKITTLEHLFKIIGPISPQATWVKEGDEFDESEFIEAEEWRRPHSLADEDRCYKLGFYKIKGPCGHFH